MDFKKALAEFEKISLETSNTSHSIVFKKTGKWAIRFHNHYTSWGTPHRRGNMVKFEADSLEELLIKTTEWMKDREKLPFGYKRKETITN